MTELNQQQCPLCQQDNQCAVALGNNPEQCWCMTANINPKAIEQIPANDRGQRCICINCGKQFKKEQ